MKKKCTLSFLGMAILLLFTSCFKELDPTDPSNPGSSGNVRSGLIAYYSFDDGTGVDSSGQDVDGILLNNPSTVDGVSGTGIFLNKFQNQYLNIPYSLFSGLNKFSVSFWIKDFNPGCIFAAQQTNGTYNDVPTLWATQESKFRFSCYQYPNGSVSFSYNYVTEGIQTGDWHHLCVTYNGAEAVLYVDGNRVDQVSANYAQNCIDGCSKVVFGGDKEGAYSYSGSMKLDEIRIYNRDLTSKEVKKLYELNN